MESVAILNGVVFAIVFGVVVSIGLDLKKWYSWLLGVYAFLSSFLIGVTSENGSLAEGLKGGTLFAFIIMAGGGIMRWRREHAKEWLQEHNKKGKRKSTRT